MPQGTPHRKRSQATHGTQRTVGHSVAELFEQRPEVGDIEKPKLVFVFDEAHLLLDEAAKPLQGRMQG